MKMRLRSSSDPSNHLEKTRDQLSGFYLKRERESARALREHQGLREDQERKHQRASREHRDYLKTIWREMLSSSNGELKNSSISKLRIFKRRVRLKIELAYSAESLRWSSEARKKSEKDLAAIFCWSANHRWSGRPLGRWYSAIVCSIVCIVARFLSEALGELYPSALIWPIRLFTSSVNTPCVTDSYVLASCRTSKRPDFTVTLLKRANGVKMRREETCVLHP